MFLAALLLAHFAPTATKTWYGLATASFETQFAGNPYDPVTNDVRVRFTSREGKRLDRLAYFYDGAWRADLVAEQPGDYTPVLMRNGIELPDAPCAQSVILLENKLDHGYLHPDSDYPTRFRFDDGTGYIPVGHNLGWPSPNKMAAKDQLAKMGESGLTWTRLWAAEWANRNPWWPINDSDANPKELWPTAIENLAESTHACDINGIDYQLVLYTHYAFSSAADGEWSKNPWNVANGGFLKSASDFFTDPEAKRRTKMWLRFAVARFGGDPNLMAYELCEDVEQTDAARDGRWQDIAAWTLEMCTYIRTLDPYDHMVTISSDLRHPEIWKPLDYYQPHLQQANPVAALAAATLPSDRPAFFGEFGNEAKKLDRPALRSALYTGLFANTGGAPMAWDWDQIADEGLYIELASAAKAVKDADLGRHTLVTKLSLSVFGCDARGIGGSDWVLMRVVADGNGPFDVQIGGLSIIQGPCSLEVIDLATGKATTSNITMANAKLVTTLPGKDCVIIVKPN